MVTKITRTFGAPSITRTRTHTRTSGTLSVALRFRGGYAQRLTLLTCLICGVALASGCSSNKLTILQSEYINTAVHLNRPVDQRTGDPLEVTIVCLYPDDLEKESNAGLKPGSGITSKGWYDNRPTHSGSGGFQVPADQVFLLTNDSQPYGTRVGRRLQGAKRDGRSEVVVTGINFRSRSMFKSGPIMYVFPKFIGPQGQVLPVPPILYSSPRQRRGIRFKIGVDPSRDHYGQYIERITDM